MRTLAIDIGGTGLKMIALDEAGVAVTERSRVLTPEDSTPDAVLEALCTMHEQHGDFARISCGFPGVVVNGTTLNAPNLDGNWAGFPLAAELEKRIGKPARVANDADVQGFGAIQGHGVELVVTLGTGIGSALFVDGTLVPNLELGHAPFRDGLSYEQVLGKAGLTASGKKRWRKALAHAVEIWTALFNPRMLFLGGGNAKKVKEVGQNVTLVDNKAGLLGGIALWR